MFCTHITPTNFALRVNTNRELAFVLAFSDILNMSTVNQSRLILGEPKLGNPRAF